LLLPAGHRPTSCHLQGVAAPAVAAVAAVAVVTLAAEVAAGAVGVWRVLELA
jgi:hypothetical protein